MNQFKVVAISTEDARYVRTSGKSPVYGFPAHKEVAAGRAPCRHCLRLIRVNEEETLLFTFDPFRELGVPALPGPVYVHSKECTRHDESPTFPNEYRGRLLTFAAYGAGRTMLKEVLLNGEDEEVVANRLFAMPEVQYVHVRSTEAGCYLFRLEPA